MRAETQFRNYAYQDNQPFLPPSQLPPLPQPNPSASFNDLDSINSSANNSPSKILSLPGFASLYQDLLVAPSTATASAPGLVASGQGLDYDGNNEWDNGDNDNDWGMGGGVGEGHMIGDGDYDMTPVEEDPQVRHLTHPHPYMACIYTYIHIHTQFNTYIHTYIHTNSLT